MNWLISALALETVLEWLICSRRVPAIISIRFACTTSAVMLFISVTGLTILDWKIWLWSVPIVLYRLVNLLRIYKARLPELQLRKVCVRAFGWLVFAQIFTTLIAWI